MKRRIFNRVSTSARPFWNVTNATGDEAELRIYDEIGFWEDTTAKAFADQLKGITANTIHLRINSPGGYINDAMAIYQQLKDHPAKVITHVDGLVASAATYPALAGDEVIMNAGGMFMIHDPLSAVWGNAEDMTKEAEVLRKFKDAIVNVYANETGLTPAKLSAMMTEETWMTADEAVANGFADRVANEEAPTAASNHFDLSIFNRVPARLNRADEQPKTVRELERFLRDAGLSNASAKSLASAAKSSLDLRDEDEEAATERAVAFLADMERSIRG